MTDNFNSLREQKREDKIVALRRDNRELRKILKEVLLRILQGHDDVIAAELEEAIRVALKEKRKTKS